LFLRLPNVYLYIFTLHLLFFAVLRGKAAYYHSRFARTVFKCSIYSGKGLFGGDLETKRQTEKG
jgi:hypothetical protein